MLSKKILHLRTINGRGKSMIIVTFAQKEKKGTKLDQPSPRDCGAGPFRSEYSPEEDLQPAPTIRMNVGLQRLIKLTRRRFLQL